MAFALAAAILSLDPYDTGWFALFPGHGVPHFGQRLTIASAARAPDIDAAILGNSTVQLLDPRRIGAETGLQVVSLAIPGTGPTEQLAVGEWLLRWHRAQPLHAMIMDIDLVWCGAETGFVSSAPFPFWLYGESRLDYALRMMRFQGLGHSLRKAKLMLGFLSRERDFGYDDYDSGRTWEEDRFEARFDDPGVIPGGGSGAESAYDFAALPRLSRFLRALSPETAVVLVMPPVYRTALPSPGSAAARRLQACKAEVRALAAERPRTEVVDYLDDPEIALHSENFWDAIHYRSAIARRLESDVSATANRLMQTRG